MLALLIPAQPLLDANTPLLLAMTTTNVLLIPVLLLEVAFSLLSTVTIPTPVPLTHVSQVLDFATMPPLPVMIKTLAPSTTVWLGLDVTSLKWSTVMTLMLALLTLAQPAVDVDILPSAVTMVMPVPPTLAIRLQVVLTFQ